MPTDRSKIFHHQSGERVLCFHGPLLYEAKIIETELWDKNDPEKLESGPHYLIHYKGWKRSWDEWVDDSRILKWSDENLRKQKQLKQAAISATRKKSSPAKAASSSTPISSMGSNPQSLLKKLSTSTLTPRKGPGDNELDLYRGRKRGREGLSEKEEEVVKKPELRISVPNTLKVKLIDDWEQITKEKLLVPLPRSPTVSEILDQYKQHYQEGAEKRKNRKHDEIIQEILNGIKLYFDKALGTILLYRFERFQYHKILETHPDSEMSDIYGAEHLLRLFVQLPVLISQANMDEDAVMALKEYLNDFLKYIQKNSKVLFAEKYIKPPPTYVSLAKDI
ncbi:hypothetical protein BB559_000097 [Furculomyces boomerangus]|uniref:Chromatin modification-related protein EAF3 n=1 Tax=Furculomyces boomerangus TaxID=61424 RepID=A0A2T9Z6C3_9FUNG|nr:hypothetical protein BB559_000097 [Furculomyces boomerangus]